MFYHLLSIRGSARSLAECNLSKLSREKGSVRKPVDILVKALDDCQAFIEKIYTAIRGHSRAFARFYHRAGQIFRRWCK
jgi:hypothetical protein